MERILIKRLVVNFLKLLTKIKLKFRFKGKIIGLSGCYGKSSAISLLEEIFRQEYKIQSTYQKGRGLNSETGITLSILNVQVDGYSYKNWIIYILKAIR